MTSISKKPEALSTGQTGHTNNPSDVSTQTAFTQAIKASPSLLIASQSMSKDLQVTSGSNLAPNISQKIAVAGIDDLIAGGTVGGIILAAIVVIGGMSAIEAAKHWNNLSPEQRSDIFKSVQEATKHGTDYAKQTAEDLIQQIHDRIKSSRGKDNSPPKIPPQNDERKIQPKCYLTLELTAHPNPTRTHYKAVVTGLSTPDSGKVKRTSLRGPYDEDFRSIDDNGIFETENFSKNMPSSFQVLGSCQFEKFTLGAQIYQPKFNPNVFTVTSIRGGAQVLRK
jgi:hypothetical protein